MKPTIGRIVHFRPDTDSTILAAIITEVHNPEAEDSTVNIRVFNNSDENLPFITSVPKNTGTDGAFNGFSWDWPTVVK